MHWGWPQWTMGILVVLSAGKGLWVDKDRFTNLLAPALQWFILWKGGFWG